MSGKRLKWSALVEQARQEPAPSVDVTGTVAAALDRATLVPTADWTTWMAAGASVAAATMMVVSLQLLGISWSEPFGDWFSSMFVVMS